MQEQVQINKIFNFKEFYLPHKPVIQKKAESIKLRVVCNALAKSETDFLLNDCLGKGPPLQKSHWMY